jgi:hypothetical protein
MVESKIQIQKLIVVEYLSLRLLHRQQLWAYVLGKQPPGTQEVLPLNFSSLFFVIGNKDWINLRLEIMSDKKVK